MYIRIIKIGAFGTFEKIWLNRSYSLIGQDYQVKEKKTRQEYSSIANSGEHNNQAKLTEKDVREIRKRYDSGEPPLLIHKDFNFVNIRTIRKVCKRETWKQVI